MQYVPIITDSVLLVLVDWRLFKSLVCVSALNLFSLDWNLLFTGNEKPISDIGTLILIIFLTRDQYTASMRTPSFIKIQLT